MSYQGIVNAVINQKGAPALYEDIAANIPAAGFTGRIFLATDTLVFYRDTGTSWAVIGGGGAAVDSITGTANQVLVNGTSGVTQTGAITLTLPQNIATTSAVQFGQLFVTGQSYIGNNNSSYPSGLVYGYNFQTSFTNGNFSNTSNGTYNYFSIMLLNTSTYNSSNIYCANGSTIFNQATSQNSILLAYGSTVQNYSTSNVDHIIGWSSTLGNSNTGTVALASHLQINAPIASAGNPITQINAIYIGAQLITGVSAANAIYQAGSSDLNYFAGQTTIANNATITGTLQVNGGYINVGTSAGSSQYIALNAAAGNARTIFFQSAGSNRWALQANNTAESGSNAGTNFYIQNRSDAGAVLNYTTIFRATGHWCLNSTTDDGVNYLQVTGSSAVTNTINIPATGAGATYSGAILTDAGTALNSGVPVYSHYSYLNYTSSASRTLSANNVYAASLNILGLTISGSSTITVTQGGSGARSMAAAFCQVNAATTAAIGSSISNVAAIVTELYSDGTHQYSIGKYYGILVSDSTQFYAANVTTRYGVYQEGSSDSNIFNGPTTFNGVIAISNAVTASTTNTVTNKIKIVANGTTYYLLASTSST